jgi:hypothetical protein
MYFRIKLKNLLFKEISRWYFINTVKGIAIKVYNGLVHINVGSMTITGVGDKLSDAKVVTKIAMRRIWSG